MRGGLVNMENQILIDATKVLNETIESLECRSIKALLISHKMYDKAGLRINDVLLECKSLATPRTTKTGGTLMSFRATILFGLLALYILAVALITLEVHNRREMDIQRYCVTTRDLSMSSLSRDPRKYVSNMGKAFVLVFNNQENDRCSQLLSATFLPTYSFQDFASKFLNIANNTIAHSAGLLSVILLGGPLGLKYLADLYVSKYPALKTLLKTEGSYKSFIHAYFEDGTATVVPPPVPEEDEHPQSSGGTKKNLIRK